MQLIKLTEIQANPHQPRKHFDEQALVELSQSIKVEGVMSPIMVRPIGYPLMDKALIIASRPVTPFRSH